MVKGIKARSGDHQLQGLQRGLEQTVKFKSRLSEEIQLLKGVVYQLQSKIDETNVKENTALCFCNQ